MRLFRLPAAVVMAALVAVTPYVSAGPSIIRDEMLQDTAITPSLGRGYSIATNTYQSMCLVDVVSTTPSYDFDYTFEDIESKTTTTGAMATTNASKGRVSKSKATQKTNSLDSYEMSDEWNASRTDSDLGGETFYHHMLATISINVYYNSVDETKSKLSPAATKILESKDLPGFFDACGMYYVRSISRRARIYSLITHTTTSAKRDVKLELSIKSAIRGFSVSGSKVPDNATTVSSVGADMIAGQEYVSQNGIYRTVFQADGNLCVYEGAGVSDCQASFEKNGASAVLEQEGHCYGRFDTPAPQPDARSACQSASGSLAVITSGRENTIVAGLGGASKPWIGGDDLTTEKSFTWATGEPFTYTNWSSGQPDNANDAEDCLQMLDNGQWNDLSCATPQPYICEAGKAKTVWCSMTKGRGARANIKNNDIAIYDASNVIVWTTSKDRVGKAGDTRLVIQNDGSLVLLSANDQQIASTGTAGTRQNSMMVGQPLSNATIAEATAKTVEKQNEQKQQGKLTTETTGKNIQISTKAIGLGKQLGTMLISYDTTSFMDAVKSAYKATLPENVGKVSAIEVVPWMENTEFQSLFKLEEKTVPVFDQFGFPVMDLTDLEKPVQQTKKVLPYEQKRILQTNAEFLAEIDRAARAKLNIFYKAKMCRGQIDADFMEMDQETGEMYFPEDKDAVANAILITKASFGANCNPANVDNMTDVLSEKCNDLVKCNYRIDIKTIGDPAPNCQKAYEVEYRCLAPAPRGFHQLAIPKEAAGKTISIDCLKGAAKRAKATKVANAAKEADTEGGDAEPKVIRPNIGQTTYVWNNRKPKESLLLEDVVDMLSERRLQTLWMEYDSFMYGGADAAITLDDSNPAARTKVARDILLGNKPELGYPNNIFPGAGRCIGELFSYGIAVMPYRSIAYCQRIEETFATVSGQRIDDYCMPRFTQVPGQESIETAMDQEAKAGDSINRERTSAPVAGPPPPAMAPVAPTLPPAATEPLP